MRPSEEPEVEVTWLTLMWTVAGNSLESPGFLWSFPLLILLSAHIPAAGGLDPSCGWVSMQATKQKDKMINSGPLGYGYFLLCINRQLELRRSPSDVKVNGSIPDPCQQDSEPPK